MWHLKRISRDNPDDTPSSIPSSYPGPVDWDFKGTSNQNTFPVLARLFRKNSTWNRVMTINLPSSSGSLVWSGSAESPHIIKDRSTGQPEMKDDSGCYMSAWRTLHTALRIITHQQEQKMSMSAENRDLKYMVMGLQLAHHVRDVYHIITVQSSIPVLLLQKDKLHSLLSWL